VPVFDTVRQAVRETGAEASITFVAPLSPVMPWTRIGVFSSIRMLIGKILLSAPRGRRRAWSRRPAR
jgi:hypothetical protein